MTRVAREFENLLLAVRSAVSLQRPATCQFLDNLVEKTKKCFADQKRNQYWGLAFQTVVPVFGLASPLAAKGLSAVVSGAWAAAVSDALAKTDASTRLQWSSKAGDILKTWSDAKGYDYQALQKQIDNASAELASVNQGQATFLQGLEGALQRHQQIHENARR